MGIATTTLRAVVGDIPLDELLAKREQINSVLRTKLDEVTERWGIKVTNVEIREIRPPRDVQESMVKQMSAERTRRAMVLEADGKRESTILVAEGDKKSAILKAEGDRQAVILRAQGYAESLTQIYGAARTIDAKTMTLQYLRHAQDPRGKPLDQIHHPGRVHRSAETAEGPHGRRDGEGVGSRIEKRVPGGPLRGLQHPKSSCGLILCFSDTHAGKYNCQVLKLIFKLEGGLYWYLEDMARRVTDASRVLNEEYLALQNNDKGGLKAALEKIKKAEEDVVMLRRALIRELAQVGTLLLNKEDLLRLAFLIEDIIGHINGVAFKLSQVRRPVARVKKYKEPLTELINLMIQEISKQNECVRALSLNTDQAIETAAQIQRLESEIDTKHREMITEVLKSVAGYRDLIVIKDVIQAIEDTSDAALRAADSSTIVALASSGRAPGRWRAELAGKKRAYTGRLFENRIVVWDVEGSRQLFKDHARWQAPRDPQAQGL